MSREADTSAVVIGASGGIGGALEAALFTVSPDREPARSISTCSTRQASPRRPPMSVLVRSPGW
jgi:hypothetical protein